MGIGFAPRACQGPGASPGPTASRPCALALDLGVLVRHQRPWPDEPATLSRHTTCRSWAARPSRWSGASVQHGSPVGRRRSSYPLSPRLIHVQQPWLSRVGAVDHRPELEHLEVPAAPADPVAGERTALLADWLDHTATPPEAASSKRRRGMPEEIEGALASTVRPRRARCLDDWRFRGTHVPSASCRAPSLRVRALGRGLGALLRDRPHRLQRYPPLSPPDISLLFGCTPKRYQRRRLFSPGGQYMLFAAARAASCLSGGPQRPVS